MFDKVAYVAGPIRAGSEIEFHQNNLRAEAIALKLWQAGFPVICPHKNGLLMCGPKGKGVPVEDMLEGDLRLMDRCDFVVMVKGWQNSVGACGEFKYAMSKNMMVYENVDDAISSESVGKDQLHDSSM